MKSSDVPVKFNIPFASGAVSSYVAAIPEASQIGISAGRASLTDGFPPDTFSPTGSGGVPPYGKDFNGILKQITQWSQWQGAGATVMYDSAFASAIGGYPIGALLSSATAGRLWLCTVENNSSNPDAGGTGWVAIQNSLATQTISAAGSPASTARFVELTGTTSTYTTTLLDPATQAGVQVYFWNNSLYDQTVATPTGLIYGSIYPVGTASVSIQSQGWAAFISDGARWIVHGDSGLNNPTFTGTTNVTNLKFGDGSVQTTAAINPVGHGQTWQDVGGSRALNTAYTNTTGRAIQASIVVAETGYHQWFFYVDGQAVSRYYLPNVGGNGLVTSVIIPSGSTYSLNQAEGVGFTTWFELR